MSSREYCTVLHGSDNKRSLDFKAPKLDFSAEEHNFHLLRNRGSKGKKRLGLLGPIAILPSKKCLEECLSRQPRRLKTQSHDRLPFATFGDRAKKSLRLRLRWYLFVHTYPIIIWSHLPNTEGPPLQARPCYVQEIQTYHATRFGHGQCSAVETSVLSIHCADSVGPLQFQIETC